MALPRDDSSSGLDLLSQASGGGTVSPELQKLVDEASQSLGLSPEAIAAMMNGGAGASDNERYVYFGNVKVAVDTGKTRRAEDGYQEPVTVEQDQEHRLSLKDAKDRIFGMNDDELLQLKLLANKAGFYDGPLDAALDDDIISIWDALTERAAGYYSQGRKMTPLDVLTEFVNKRGGGGGSSTTTSTHTEIDLTDPQTARGILEDAMARRLGRAAKPDEISKYVAALNSYESGRPQVTTTTKDGSGNTSSVTSGGAGNGRAGDGIAQDFMVDQMGEEVAGVTGQSFLQVFMDMLGG